MEKCIFIFSNKLMLFSKNHDKLFYFSSLVFVVDNFFVRKCEHA